MPNLANNLAKVKQHIPNECAYLTPEMAEFIEAMGKGYPTINDKQRLLEMALEGPIETDLQELFASTLFEIDASDEDAGLETVIDRDFDKFGYAVFRRLAVAHWFERCGDYWTDWAMYSRDSDE